MELKLIYKKSFTKKWLVRLKTKHPDGDAYDGIVLKETKSFVVLALEKDFEFYSICILAKKYIRSFRDGKFEKCFNKILRFNGQIRKLKLPRWLSRCEEIENVFRAMKRRNIWPIVEILFNKNKRSDFYIGSIVGGNDKEVGIRSYNAAGDWEKEYVLNYNEILRIEFNDKYSKHFNNFMKTKRKQKKKRKKRGHT